MRSGEVGRLCLKLRDLSEEGKHAAESGMELKAYAEKAGKARETLSKKVMAWRVLSVVHVDHKQARDRFKRGS